MSRDLPEHAVERLLSAGAPLREDPAAGAVDLERYELRGVLGRGGMGVVYEAWDRELGRKVALKVLASAGGLSGPARQRFLREARAAAKLAHPNIATVYDATPEAIAMQRVEGVTLSEAHLDARTLARLVRDAALAIHFAHGEGIVHRDLKPANLMVERGDRPHVYVMDFGLVKERAALSTLSASGAVVGTPAFMAPEQAASRTEDVGPATDVYGLGATLYACLAGRPPFEGDDVLPLLRRVVEEEPPGLATLAPGVHPDLATIVMKCLAKEPRARYATALALAGDLDRWLRGEPVHARPPSTIYRLRRFVSRRQGAVIASAVAASIALLGAAPFLVRSHAERRAAEGRREVAEGVLTLSARVNETLANARAARKSGGGYEQEAHGMLAEAIAECRAFLALNEVGHVWLLLGELLHEKGDLREALVALDRADALRGDIARLPRERGVVLAELYRDGVPILGEVPPAELETWRTRAASELSRALAGDESTPETADGMYALALMHWVKNDRELAIDRAKAAIEMDIGHQRAHLALSRLYLLTDRAELGMRESVIATDLMRGARPAYVASRSGLSPSGVDPSRFGALLDLAGIDEVLIDFNRLLQDEPGDASFYGFRGQVQLRKALLAMEREAWIQAWQGLEVAVRELSAALALDGAHAPALVDRAVCHALLDRVLSASSEVHEAAAARDAALADYDAAIAADRELDVAWYDRALLRLRRARVARDAGRDEEAEEELAHARSDVEATLARFAPDHPYRERVVALARELGEM